MKTLAIIPAGGMGQRMGGPVAKQYLPLAGIPVLAHTLRRFQDAPSIDEIFLAVPEADIPEIRWAIVDRYGLTKVKQIIPGGRQRQDTVRNALRQAGAGEGIILVHDGVRPFVTPSLIERVVAAARRFGAVTVGIPVKDTVKEVNADGWVDKTVDRERLWLTQTPQAFAGSLLIAAYEWAEKERIVATDDAALVERMGVPVQMIPGDEANIKLTTVGDLALGEVLLGRLAVADDSAWEAAAVPTGHRLPPIAKQQGGSGMQIGFGFDSHRLVEGRKLILGGKEIPFEKGLLGHSDADVLIHALCDALLGALGQGDIGRQFPDTDPATQGISSLILLERVGQIAAQLGYRVVHCDCTVILEKPKLAPYMAEMIANMATALRIPPACVSVKAKTNEGMGLVGEGQGAAAFAVATVEEGLNP